MNVYDTVNKLASEIRESEEYKKYKELKQRISENSEYKDKISNFEKKRYEEQIKSIQTGESDENQMKEIQLLYQDLINIPEIKEYFDAEFKFNIMLGDVNKIISEAVRDVIQ